MMMRALRTISDRLRVSGDWLRASWPLDLGDAQLIAGFGALVYGVSQWSAPSAWCVAGVLLLAGWLAPRLPRAKKGS